VTWIVAPDPEVINMRHVENKTDHFMQNRRTEERVNCSVNVKHRQC